MIYHRIHSNKSLFFNHGLIKDLIKSNFKIFVVGDKLNISKVKNLGYIKKKKLDYLQSRSKYSLSTGENIYSLFIIECITNHMKIFINKENIKKVRKLKKFFITFDKSTKNLNKIKC